jgi:hypothetical protein
VYRGQGSRSWLVRREAERASAAPGDFFGSALNDAYGLLNSDELRDNLRRHPEQPLALMVSQEIYDGVVRHGYGAINPADYFPTTVHLKHGTSPPGSTARPARL